MKINILWFVELWKNFYNLFVNQFVKIGLINLSWTFKLLNFVKFKEKHILAICFHLFIFGELICIHEQLGEYASDAPDVNPIIIWLITEDYFRGRIRHRF